ncbi:MAG: hypothetical protein IPO62_00200 [Saprospiraceae bacterium]|nr:hypothetical protein [Saprospiraceae bacterium]MBK9629484.1 hypothetical protein [Saprospiraceae bacterium]
MRGYFNLEKGSEREKAVFFVATENIYLVRMTNVLLESLYIVATKSDGPKSAQQRWLQE